MGPWVVNGRARIFGSRSLMFGRVRPDCQALMSFGPVVFRKRKQAYGRATDGQVAV